MTTALFQNQIARRILLSAVITMGITVCCACSFTPADSQPTEEDCVGEMSRRIRQAPEKEYLETLDGQKVRLQDFFNQCRDNAPDCALYAKFYHWENEVLRVVSRTDKGAVEHQIRAYYNPLSVCQPQNIHPGRTHGDVAEFYDSRGRFMGLAVYMGQGKYITLHYSNYKGSAVTP